MIKKTVVITETDGGYQVDNKGIAEFALLGILECIVFEMKSARRAAASAEPDEPAVEPKKAISEAKEIEREIKPEAAEETKPEVKKDATEPQSSAPDLRTRISNAIKAIRSLGGNIEDTDLSRLTDEELQAELKELTSQYKQLKAGIH